MDIRTVRTTVTNPVVIIILHLNHLVSHRVEVAFSHAMVQDVSHFRLIVMASKSVTMAQTNRAATKTVLGFTR